MNNKLKRTDFFENFKLSTTLNEIFVVVVHTCVFTIGEKHGTQSFMLFVLICQWKTALNLSRINYLECFAKIANQRLILTMHTVKKPIRARSPNFGETAGYWNTIRNGVTQTSLFRVKQRK